MRLRLHRTLSGHEAAPVSLVPVLRNVAVPMGAYTILGGGGVKLSSALLGLIAPNSPEVLFWRTAITSAVGGGATSDLQGALVANTAVATAKTPTPSLGLSTALSINLIGTYVITCTAVGADNSEASCTLTYNIVANTFNLGDDNASFGRPDDLDAIRLNMGTSCGGKTMALSRGANFEGANMSLYGFVPSSGRFTVAYADVDHPSRCKQVFVQACKKLDLRGIAVGGIPANRITITADAAGDTDDCHAYGCYSLNADPTNLAPGSPGDNYGILIHGSVSNCSAEDCNMQYVGKAYSLSGTSNSMLRNKFRYIYGDARVVGQGTGLISKFNVFMSPMRSANNDDHMDALQIEDNSTINGFTSIGDIFIQADGNAGMIGTHSGATLTTSWLCSASIIVGRTVTGMQVGANHLGVWRDCTVFETGSGFISNATVDANDNIYTGSQRTLAPAGDGAFLRYYTNGFIQLGGGTTYSKTDCVELDHAYSEIGQLTFGVDPINVNAQTLINGATYDFSNVHNYADAFERLNNYHPSLNPNGTDYPNMTLDQIVTRVLTVLAPKLTGQLDLGGGNSIGAINFDHTQKAA